MSNPNQETIPARSGASDTLPGLRLRQAREQAGLTVAEAANQLRLRSHLLDAIEREDLAALGAPVFARGYIDSYVRLLGLPRELVDELLPPPQSEPIRLLPSQSVTPQSRKRLWFDQLARRFVYVALTASIVIPVFLLATCEPLPDPDSLLAPLEFQSDESMDRAAIFTPDDTVGPPAAEHAVMASFTPFYSNMRASQPAPATKAIQPPPPQGLVLELTGDSWIEVTGSDGTRLMHDLLRAGSAPSFDPEQVERVLIGNAAAVKVLLDGETMDISAYRRANVARFAVSSTGLTAPQSE